MNYSKYIILALIYSAIAGNLYSHEEPPKTLYEKFKKQEENSRLSSQGIKEVKVYMQKMSVNEPEGKKFLYLKMKYNQKGEMISIEQFNPDSQLTASEYYTYNDKGSMITDEYYDSAGTKAEYTEYSFDSNGCVTGAVNYAAGKKDSEFFYYKDPDTGILLFTKIDSSSATEYMINYIFEGNIESGRMIKAVKLSPKGDTLQKVENDYDDNGFIIHRRVYIKGSEMSYSLLFINSSKGKPIEIRKKLPDETIDNIQKYTYDLNNNLLNIITTDSGGFIKAKTEYEYLK